MKIAQPKAIGKTKFAIRIHFEPSKMIFSVKPTQTGILFGMQKIVSRRVVIASTPAKIVPIILFFFILLQ